MADFFIDKSSFCEFIDSIKKYTQTICKAEKILSEIEYDNDYGIHHIYTESIVNFFTSVIIDRYNRSELAIFADKGDSFPDESGVANFRDIIEDILYDYIYGWTDRRYFIFDNSEDLYFFLTRYDLLNELLKAYEGE